jgi:hypothetical protein
VTRITRSVSGTIISEVFTIDYPDWRIRWEFDPGHWHFEQFYFLNITAYQEGESENHLVHIHASVHKLNGTQDINENYGKYYLKITQGMIESFTIIVEQNIDSIPEFPFWIILPITLAVCSIAIVMKRRWL